MTTVAKLQALVSAVAAAINLRAKLASPIFTGTPQAPTAGVGTSTTQLATTAFVLGQAGSATPLVGSGAGAAGTSTLYARQDHVHPATAVTLGLLNVSNTTMNSAVGATALTYVASALTGTLTTAKAGSNVMVDVQVSMGAVAPTSGSSIVLAVSIDGGTTKTPIGRFNAYNWIAGGMIGGNALFTGVSVGAHTVTVYITKDGGAALPSVKGDATVPAQLIAVEMPASA